ncbi:methyltransferase family protein [Mobilisporobacter senegalensis]|uniref:Methyltransferase family protein n=1 Tax=Mobilisporobacter senegalensis TaxID=1329262 RepID=A0A3N1XHX2_9FIRM|nr:class I SAM-dependent methyltransferase [Mobilisporobacter senegalensis]ROR26309.1 methyltransferase family protein [Mobilisporobacter senegalensis]
MNLTKYIGEQFGKPTGIGGRLSTFIMNRMNQKQYKSVIKAIGSNPQEKILDVGFGNGYLINKLAKHSQSQFYGIEISEDMVELARKRNHKFIQGNRMHLEKGNVLNMDYRNDFFDGVYTVNTIYFWSDIDRGLSEIKRVLKPGGLFVNAIYSKEFLDKLKYTDYGFSKYTPTEIEEAALRNELKIVNAIEIKPNLSYCFILQK